MVDILDEVRDDIRNERFSQLWHRGTTFYFWFALLAIVVTSVVVGYNYYHQSQLQKEGDRLYTAIQSAYDKSGDVKGAISDLESVSKQATTTKPLSELKQAELLIASGNARAALAIYTSIATHTHYDVGLRDLAQIYAIYVSLEHNLKKPRDFKTTLVQLARTDGPYRFSAKELLLVVAMDEHNNQDQQTLLASLMTDPLTPNSIRQRAQELKNSLFPGQELLAARGKTTDAKKGVSHD